MRKRFVYFVLVPILIAGIIIVLFIDRWVELGLEAAGEALVGARVEIDHLHVSLVPIGIRWEKMQVADPHDPWRNLFETRRVQFALNTGQLLREKYIIETLEIDELIIGTPRVTDGSISRAPEAPSAATTDSSFTALASQTLDRAVEKAPLTSVDLSRGGFNADSLVKALDIRTIVYLDSLKRQTLTTSKQWETLAGEFETSRKAIAQAEKRIVAINPSQLTTMEAITSALSTVNDAANGVNDISAAFSRRKTSIVNDIRILTSSLAGVEKVAADDFARLRRLAHLPNLNSSGIARMLVGEEMFVRARSYLRWIDIARKHIRNYEGTPGIEKPARMKGQNIRFPADRVYPKFWVKKVLVSGGTDSSTAAEFVHARGKIDNISDDQRMTGVPMTASLRGIAGGKRTFALTATFDRTKDIPSDEYTGMLGGVPLAAFRLGSSGFLDATLTGATMNSTVNVSVPGSAFDASSRIVLSGFTLHFGGEPKTMFERIVRETLQGIDAFAVGLRLWNTGAGFDIALSTDLDTKIAEHAQAILGAAYSKAQAELKTTLDGAISRKRAEVEKLVEEKRAEIEGQLSAYQSLVDQNLAMVEAKRKELMDQLEKEKQGKVNDLLKGILKK